MARVIKLNQIADFMGDQVDQLVRAVTLEASARIKEQSPVDLGTFKNSWQTQIDPGLGKISNALPYAEKLAEAAGGAGSKTVTRYDPKRKVRTWASPGKGSSIQTNGPSWLELIAKEMEGYARSEYERIKRKS
jgi:hypothetical protein